MVVIRHSFIPLLVITAFVSFRHIILSAYLTDRVMTANVRELRKFSDPDMEYSKMRDMLQIIDKYEKRLALFSWLDKKMSKKGINATRGALKHWMALLDRTRDSGRFEAAEKIQKWWQSHHIPSLGVLTEEQLKNSRMYCWVGLGLTALVGFIRMMSRLEE